MLGTWALLVRYAGQMGLARRHKGPFEPERRPSELQKYVGLWVAVKDGKVIAAAETSRDLVHSVRKLGSRGEGAVAQRVPKPSNSSLVGVG